MLPVLHETVVAGQVGPLLIATFPPTIERKRLWLFVFIYKAKKKMVSILLVCRYAQYGDVSPKVDVYAFGVVLYELISAKEAIVRTSGSMADSTGLVALVRSFPSILSIMNTEL